MQITMNARPQKTFGTLRPLANDSAKVVPAFGEPLQKPQGLTVASTSGGRNRPVELGQHARADGTCARNDNLFRREARVDAGLGKYFVHLPDTFAGLASEKLVLVEAIAVVICKRGGALVDQALKMVESPRPAVALVGHICLRDHDGCGCALGVSPQHFPEESWSAGKAVVRKKSAHLSFGMIAGPQFAKQFDHHLTADNHGGIGLLSSRPFKSFQIQGAVQFEKMLRGTKKDFPSFNRNTLFVEEAINDGARQSRGRERIGQKPDLRAFANARKRQWGFKRVRSIFFPGDCHGKGVARLATLIGRRNLAVQEFV